ncbi:hypothetical protein [Jannaschia sp. CCS1]|uniref:hypothetical protein n=1 Tax=Jannaschia sp. (strain CCS1) TaxID=290400 RepID=UPI000053D99D|nr:hypothetical protein [Jannaschia sp. CCS1]ABD55897.1 hypothetical protein Jann_2980 [Jannaschia sp. CCS1]
MQSFVFRTLGVVAACLAVAGPASANPVSYCFDNSSQVNVFIFQNNGFLAHPAGRPGNTLFYRRVGNTNRYVGDTGAIYTFLSNAQVTWTDGRQIIPLTRC